MKLAVTLLFLVAAFCAFAQNNAGIVVDSKTGERLPYVRIGIVGKNVGTISRDDGQFSLQDPNITSTDTVVFSMVGYTPYKIVYSDLQMLREIRLREAVQILKAVTVSAEEIVVLNKLGRPEPTKTTLGHSGSGEWGTGGEWGLLIKPGNDQFILQTVAFHTRFNNVDSVLFRINIYEFNGNTPGKSMLTEELYVTSKKRNKWITKDVRDRNIQVDKNFVVTMEIIRIWYSKTTDNQLFFTHGKDPMQLTTFSRESSHAPWQQNKMPPLAMYVLGRKINE